MFAKFENVAERICAFTTRPIGEPAWHAAQKRIVTWAVIVGAVLAVQTALVRSPEYIIGAMYHNRQAITLNLDSASPKKRTKMLQRLCLAEALFHQGGHDPYNIKGADACMKEPLGQPGDNSLPASK